ncbi:DNA polymerase III subunits gamma and tau [Candidatus Rickettsiella viridis]|uniref:DNA polymerase III subunit gamma/tau n=1 Tax=Candidatus Rickettsiella viridis TaxID=676208 RepID=A0A2Z5UVL5_9COXI|nr:DNA polymerase III subunit gamma/tau [Candidatus Rickettsiella viridis]BBB15000.1 DNA polymerase III subunits gamma and tau [Candidatus Rickettsiella viridis]
MSYQVLARKYRPRSFTQLVGQESTCRILKNALDSQRIHHAYLFTGTRGVGKTSLARLLAKCLNCATKITAEPCDQCSACQAINANRFTDLLEVDAASRTKVEDTRDLLADIHYAPSQGRYKVYLIDEVHMLSSHSFNALLKTLEEPPPHVVFLLATTDPQRLPATILSRCLQFHLKALSVEQISQHLETILKNEQVPYELNALQILAQASRGSLRDSLSLLDQAIAYAKQTITEQDIKTLLGSVATTDITELLEALILQDAVKLWTIVEKLNAQAADFLQVIDALLTHLHQMALIQVLPASMTKENECIQPLAQQLSAEDTQLYYQIALLSRRDLSLAPTPRLGFEMMLLRMLAFNPIKPAEKNQSPVTKSLAPAVVSLAKDRPSIENNKLDKTQQKSALDWITLVKQLNLTGLSYTFACQCVLQKYANNQVKLLLDPKQTALHTPKQEERLAQALSKHFAQPIGLTISLGGDNLLTPARYEQQQKAQRLEETTKNLQEDPTLQAIIKTFDAKLQPESIQFLDEN